jgi:TonB family protein
MIKTAVYLAGFYIIYFTFLSRDTKYLRNRVFILFSVISAFLLPLISVNIKEESGIYYFGKTLSEVLVTAESGKSHSIFSFFNGIDTFTLIIRLYFTGVIAVTLKLIADLLNLWFLILRNRSNDEHIIYFKGFKTSGFSAMGYIFINRNLNAKDADEIIRHEQNHLDNKHFIDILFIEAALILQWFNPFIYLINRSLRAIHEYQADQECLRSGMPVIRYQRLLLNNVFRSGRVKISNSFSNPSLIRKRMIMMVKEPSGNSSSLKILFAIPVTVLFLLIISACEKNILAGATANNTSDHPQHTVQVPKEIFTVVEEMPAFPGGDAELMKFINSKVVYPEAAKEKGITGRVIIRFTVTYKGLVKDPQVLVNANPDLDAEALRVIGLFPKWTPGLQGGKPVNVYYSIPVTFSLK